MHNNQKKNGKVLLLGNSKLVIFGFRGELIEKLVQEGYDVSVAFPNGPFGEGENISKKYGCNFFEIPINRKGKNPIEELNLLKKYILLIYKIKPDVVLAFTVKCDIYGGIACRILKVPFIPNITGLGKGLAEGGLTEIITRFLYKASIKKSKCVFFQNIYDKQFFIDKKINFKNCKVLPGSGVNLSKFYPLPYPDKEPVAFTYIARIMKAKGIEQFLEAAYTLKKEGYNTEFHICGYCEEDYKSIIDYAVKKGIVVYHGLVGNIMEYEKASHCVVLPSFHPEGISNVLLEAAACARPIITTDRPGCRETVEDGITGYLVREKDSYDLIDKMKKFISLTDLEKKEMGMKGRIKVEKEFGRKIVVDSYLAQISEL